MTDRAVTEKDTDSIKKKQSRESTNGRIEIGSVLVHCSAESALGRQKKKWIRDRCVHVSSSIRRSSTCSKFPFKCFVTVESHSGENPFLSSVLQIFVVESAHSEVPKFL